MSALKQSVTFIAGALLSCSHAPPKPAPQPSLVPAFWEACKQSGYKEGSAEHIACVQKLIHNAYPPSEPKRSATCTNMGGGTVTCTEN
jgi:hypothetical protein